MFTAIRRRLPELGMQFLDTLEDDIIFLQDACPILLAEADPDASAEAEAAWIEYAAEVLPSKPIPPRLLRPELPPVDSKWSGFSLVYTVIGCQAETHDRPGLVYLMHPLQSEWLVLDAHEFWKCVDAGILESEMDNTGACKGCGANTGGKMSCALNCPIDGEVA